MVLVFILFYFVGFLVSCAVSSSTSFPVCRSLFANSFLDLSELWVVYFVLGPSFDLCLPLLISHKPLCFGMNKPDTQGTLKR